MEWLPRAEEITRETHPQHWFWRFLDGTDKNMFGEQTEEALRRLKHLKKKERMCMNSAYYWKE